MQRQISVCVYDSTFIYILKSGEWAFPFFYYYFMVERYSFHSGLVRGTLYTTETFRTHATPMWRDFETDNLKIVKVLNFF